MASHPENEDVVPLSAERRATAPSSGQLLHRERVERGERLVGVAERAGVSMQYLSEIERGLKDPSSEMLQAIAGALDLSVRELAVRTARPDALALAA